MAKTKVTFNRDDSKVWEESENIDGKIYFRKNGIFVDGYQYAINKEECESKENYDKYLTFEAETSGTFSFTNEIYYSIDEGNEWNILTANTDSPTIESGSTIMWRQTSLTPTSSAGIGTFSSTGNFIVYGNIMSLLYGDDFNSNTTLPNYAFYKLFDHASGLLNAENLILPSDTLSVLCYRQMFGFCENLTKAPELPALTLGENCYLDMFFKCTSLTTAPELNSKNLAVNCYRSMFNQCSSLVNILKTLPAVLLLSGCYQSMFKSCTSLTTAPELPAETLVIYCYCEMFNLCSSLYKVKADFKTVSLNQLDNWLNNVSSTGVFIKSDDATWDITGASGIPSGWTVKYDLIELTKQDIIDNERVVAAALNDLDANKQDALPLPPSTDGTYKLVVTVTNGVSAYSWVNNN